MSDINRLSLGCLFNHLLWEYIILFAPTLSRKQLGRKTRLGVNGKAPESNTNKSTKYLFLVEFLEDYTDGTSYSTTKSSLHSCWCDRSKPLGLV
jgi:hypothetical protein